MSTSFKSQLQWRSGKSLKQWQKGAHFEPLNSGYMSGIGKKKMFNLRFWVHKVSPFSFRLHFVSSGGSQWEKMREKSSSEGDNFDGISYWEMLLLGKSSKFLLVSQLTTCRLGTMAGRTSDVCQTTTEETGDYPNATNHGRLATSSDKTQT